MSIQAAARSCATALAIAALAPCAWAGDTFEFAGTVTEVYPLLLGGGVGLGDPVYLRFTLGPPVVDTDPAASVGAWTGALATWRLDIGGFFISGAGGDVQICNSPFPGQTNCGSAISYPQFSGTLIGSDGVRFVGTQLTSPPLVINGITQGCSGAAGSSQCVTAAVYDASATALNGTAIPPFLDPTLFNFGTGRVPFGASGQLTYSVTAVPEPSTTTLMLAGLALAGVAAGVARRSGVN